MYLSFNQLLSLPESFVCSGAVGGSLDLYKHQMVYLPADFGALSGTAVGRSQLVGICGCSLRWPSVGPACEGDQVVRSQRCKCEREAQLDFKQKQLPTRNSLHFGHCVA
eukprot:TRINITY_DN14605_c0_g1_i3.p1 TRINITY_DN14605_c0_g1~~TRINITY_DN14605_c0_g1_i3.p1  ORF type:complete len:109 (-),score=6.27 TRINITY_DN14605_c0_g1_i3:182-508(-)